MSKAEKLLQRFLSKTKDFSYDELRRLLRGPGYVEAKSGKTGGSPVAFINLQTKSIIRLHRPHRSPVLKEYQINDVEESLRKAGMIK
jgi:hypothetical protein